ncbi:MAG: hypothetical protein ACRECH_05865 [Nitrososphaerales archaeon]
MTILEPAKQKKCGFLDRKTVSWTLSDGKADKSIYLHRFGRDGSIVYWGEVSEKARGSERAEPCLALRRAVTDPGGLLDVPEADTNAKYEKV